MCDHEIMRMSKMMVEKYKQGMARHFEKGHRLPGKGIAKQRADPKIGKSKTGDGKSDSDLYGNDKERGPVDITVKYLNKFVL